MIHGLLCIQVLNGFQMHSKKFQIIPGVLQEVSGGLRVVSMNLYEVSGVLHGTMQEAPTDCKAVPKGFQRRSWKFNGFS